MKSKFKLIIISILVLAFLSFSQDNWPPKFENYLIDSIYKGKIANPNFNTNKEAKKFRTTIKYSMKKAKEKNEINFAGHFIICEWGCGIGCQENVVVDAITGRIINGVNTCLGFESKGNSKLLITTPEVDSSYGENCITKYYLLENDSLIELITK